MQIILSTGETVTFKQKFTHKADKVYWTELEKGVVYEEGPDRKIITKGFKPGHQADAVEACMLCLIVRIEKDGKETQPTLEWMDELDVEDYGLLAKAVTDLRKGVDMEKGKKNS